MDPHSIAMSYVEVFYLQREKLVEVARAFPHSQQILRKKAVFIALRRALFQAYQKVKRSPGSKEGGGGGSFKLTRALLGTGGGDNDGAEGGVWVEPPSSARTSADDGEVRREVAGLKRAVQKLETKMELIDQKLDVIAFGASARSPVRPPPSDSADTALPLKV